MALGLPAYRVTSDDLVDADKKVARGVGPLLDALNRCLTPIITVVNALSLPTAKVTTFTTSANGSAYLALGVGAPMTDVWVTGLTPSDGSTLDTVYSMSWVPTSAGAQLLFVGLAPLTTYNVRVRYE